MQNRGNSILIDAELVAELIDELSRFGAYGDTGVWRTVYSPEWIAAQQCVAGWFRESGFAVSHDTIGNVWGELRGTTRDPAIVTGSHIDSQTPGGRYDGALGVIAGYVALRVLYEEYGSPRRTLRALSLCEEESSRFHGARMLGTRAITGQLGSDEADSLVDFNGETLAEAMRAAGLDPRRIDESARSDFDTFVELHIEQGPILEEAGCAVGIVDAITGVRHYVIEIIGRSDHAGARPMDTRLDPMAGAAEIISRTIDTATQMGRPAVTTCGHIDVQPNLAAAVPERVSMTLDARHPEPIIRTQLYARHEEVMRSVATRRGLTLNWSIPVDVPPCVSDSELVRLFRQVAEDQGIEHMTIQSGAGHDAMLMAKAARIVMIFVRSEGGRSHTPAEFTSVDDAVAGISVLAAGLHRLAY